MGWISYSILWNCYNIPESVKFTDSGRKLMIFNPAKQEIEHYPEFCRIFIWIKFNQTAEQLFGV